MFLPLFSSWSNLLLGRGVACRQNATNTSIYDRLWTSLGWFSKQFLLMDKVSARKHVGMVTALLFPFLTPLWLTFPLGTWRSSSHWEKQSRHVQLLSVLWSGYNLLIKKRDTTYVCLPLPLLLSSLSFGETEQALLSGPTAYHFVVSCLICAGTPHSHVLPPLALHHAFSHTLQGRH